MNAPHSPSLSRFEAAERFCHRLGFPSAPRERGQEVRGGVRLRVVPLGATLCTTIVSLREWAEAVAAAREEARR